MKDELKDKEIDVVENDELSDDDLEQVAGGSLRDVIITKTVDISDDVKRRI